MSQPRTKRLPLEEFFRTLVRRKRLFSLILLASIVLAIVAFFVTKTKYTAVAVINYQKDSSDAGLSDLLSSATGGADALTESIDLQTQAKILQSNDLMVAVAQRLSLDKTDDYQPHFSLLETVRGWLSSAGLRGEARPEEPPNVPLDQTIRRRARVIKIFDKNLQVQLLAGTHLIQIEYTSSSPTQASNVANALVEQLNDYNFQTKYKASKDVTTWLEAQLDDLRKSNEDLQKRVVAAQQETGLFGVLGSEDQQGRPVIYAPALDQFEYSTTQLDTAQTNQILKGAIYQITKTGNADLISQLGGTTMNIGTSQGLSDTFTTLDSLRTQQATLQAQIAKDAGTFGSSFPRLLQERTQLAKVNELIESEMERIQTRAKHDYEVAQQVTDKVKREYDSTRNKAESLNNKTIEFAILKREADSSESLYQDLLKRLKESGIIETLRSSNITSVDRAAIPFKPSKPRLGLYLALGLFGGLLLAGTSVNMLDRIYDHLLGPGDVEDLGLPVFGIVPLVERKEAVPLDASGTRVRPAVQMVDAPMSGFSESMRHLRSSLLMSRSATPPQVILITSPSPQEGKSTISVELAVCLSQLQGEVLLVEGDMRRPVLGKRLSLTGQSGLSRLLTDATLAPQFEHIDVAPNLSIVPAGPVPPSTAELLASSRMKELIQDWRQQFRFIVIDGAPLLAVSDSLALAEHSDALLLVARSEKTGRSAFLHAKKILLPFVPHGSDRVMGAILNGMSYGNLKYYGYYDSSYKGYYGSYTQEK